MRFGLALETFTPPRKKLSVESILEMSKLAESYAFDSVWAWDHIVLGSKNVFPILDPLTTLATVGGKTSRLNLGTGILLLPLRNPLLLAKMLSSLQILTSGRLITGLASGWYEREFKAVGINYSRRGEIFEQNFKLLRKLLNDKDISYSIGDTNIDHISLEPRHEKQIPLLAGGYANSVLRRCGRIADGWISYYYSPNNYEEAWRVVSENASSIGRDTKLLRRINIVPLCIAKSFEEGDKIARSFTSDYTDLPRNTGCTIDSAIRGTIDDCTRLIRKYESIGIDDLILIPSYYDKDQVESFGKEILPRFLKK